MEGKREAENMTNTQLSSTMEEALVYLGRGVYRAHMEPAKRTLVALESRGMIVWTSTLTPNPVQTDFTPTYDTTRLWTVTVAGWAFLKDAYQIERPADAGRLSVDEALADIERIAEDDRIVAADLDAAYALEDAEEMARVDAGRWTLEECFSYGGWHAIGLEDDRCGAMDAEDLDACGNCADCTREEDPAPPRRDGWLILGRTYPSFGEAAGDALSHNAHMAARIAASRAAEAPRRDGWLEEGRRIQETSSGHWISFPEGTAEIRDEIVVSPVGTPNAVVQEADRLTRAKDDRVTGYWEHVPEDDMYVDRDAWKAAETRLRQVATDAADTRSQYGLTDTRSQYVRRDANGAVITYRNIPVPTDLASRWSGIEAISWTRGVESVHRANLSAVQQMRMGL